MSTLRKIVSAWILTAAALAAQTVDGRVTNSATGDGISGVLVGLVGLGQTAYTSTTDSSGRFRMDGVKDGSYTPYYKAAGFWSAAGSASPTFHVKAGAAVHLEYQMFAVARIAGRVLDGAEKPVPNATVVFQELRAGNYWVVTANSNGEYQGPESMEPGAWKVMATLPVSLEPPPARDGQKFGWAQTYYPGVTDAASATPLLLTGGDEMRGIDIKLAAVPTHRVSGMVLDSSGKPALNISVSLAGGGVGAAPSLREKTDAEEGRFQFETVLAGDVRASATMIQDGVKLWAGQWLQLSGKDVEDVVLRPAAPFSLSGRIVFDVPDGVAAPRMPGLGLLEGGQARGMFGDGPGDAMVEGVPNDHGDFIIKNLYPGPYQVMATKISRPDYVDSIRLGDRDALAPAVQISSGALPLIISYKRNGGTVWGSVEGCDGCTVLLIPQDVAWRRNEFTHQTRCDSNGHFEIGAVRPGDYYAMGLARDDSRARASAFDDSWLNQAVRVTVRPNEATDAEVRLVRR